MPPPLSAHIDGTQWGHACDNLDGVIMTYPGEAVCNKPRKLATLLVLVIIAVATLPLLVNPQAGIALVVVPVCVVAVIGLLGAWVLRRQKALREHELRCLNVCKALNEQLSPLRFSIELPLFVGVHHPLNTVVQNGSQEAPPSDGQARMVAALDRDMQLGDLVDLDIYELLEVIGSFMPGDGDISVSPPNSRDSLTASYHRAAKFLHPDRLIGEEESKRELGQELMKFLSVKYKEEMQDTEHSA